MGKIIILNNLIKTENIKLKENKIILGIITLNRPYHFSLRSSFRSDSSLPYEWRYQLGYQYNCKINPKNFIRLINLNIIPKRFYRIEFERANCKDLKTRRTYKISTKTNFSEAKILYLKQSLISYLIQKYKLEENIKGEAFWIKDQYGSIDLIYLVKSLIELNKEKGCSQEEFDNYISKWAKELLKEGKEKEKKNKNDSCG